MRNYLIRRLILSAVTLFLVTLLVFFTIRFIPGDVVEMMISEHEHITATTIDEIRHKLGLDVPVTVQYVSWIKGIIMYGDFGRSLWTDIPVTEEIVHRWPITLELGLLALMVALSIALPVGIYSAIRQDTRGDYIGRSLAIACITLPSFWLGTLVMVFPAIWWHWTPSLVYIPFVQNPIGNLVQFIVPAIILGMVISGVTMRMTRTMMLEVLRQDYIRTAWAKGLREREVVIRHALRNAMIPVITVIGLQAPLLIGGSVVMEQIFCLPGLGALMIQILSNRDYTMLSGVNLFIACSILLINLVVDLTYGFLDPRVQFK